MMHVGMSQDKLCPPNSSIQGTDLPVLKQLSHLVKPFFRTETQYSQNQVSKMFKSKVAKEVIKYLESYTAFSIALLNVSTAISPISNFTAAPILANRLELRSWSPYLTDNIKTF